VLRFNLVRRLRDLEEAQGQKITWKEVSEKTGVSVSVLSSLSSLRPGITTNTRTIEALCRYLKCSPGELLDLHPSLSDEPRHHINELYPPRGELPAS
jgi:putative transcriptional regulator